jgi:hypothetical protein
MRIIKTDNFCPTTFEILGFYFKKIGKNLIILVSKNTVMTLWDTFIENRARTSMEYLVFFVEI